MIKDITKQGRRQLEAVRLSNGLVKLQLEMNIFNLDAFIFCFGSENVRKIMFLNLKV